MARLEEDADDWLADYAAGEMGKATDGGDDEPPPLRLSYPLGYILHAWADYIRHGTYPKPGGFDAQDVALVADFSALTKRYNWHIRRLMDEDSDGGLRQRRAAPRAPADDLLTISRQAERALTGGVDLT